jgi:hypothetical protein
VGKESVSGLMMKCICENPPKHVVSYLPTPSPTKVVEKIECPACFVKSYTHKYVAEEGVALQVSEPRPRLLGSGRLLCRVCNTLSPVLVLHKSRLMCMVCKREDDSK